TIDTLDAFNDDKVTISFSQETIYTEFDTNSGQREYKVSKKFTLDNEGFIEKEATSTFLDLINLLRKEELKYATSDVESRYISNKVCERNILNSTDTKIYGERLYYDGEELCFVTQGLSSSFELFNGTSYELKKSYLYTNFGAISKIKDSLNRETTISYDSLNLHPISVVNPAGHSKTTTYSNVNGTLETYVDENGHATNYSYDPYYRLIKIVGVNDSPLLPTEEYVYNFGDYDSLYSSVFIKKREKSGLPGTFNRIEFYDGKGRKVSQISEGKTNEFVLEAFKYNLRSKESFKSQKSFYHSFEQPSLLEVDALKGYTTFYDALLR